PSSRPRERTSRRRGASLRSPERASSSARRSSQLSGFQRGGIVSIQPYPLSRCAGGDGRARFRVERTGESQRGQGGGISRGPWVDRSHGPLPDYDWKAALVSSARTAESRPSAGTLCGSESGGSEATIVTCT